jgi:cellulase/cellobiase CelA1
MLVVAAVKTESSIEKRQATSKPKSIIESTKEPPTCIAMVSTHPGANPYHPLLTPPDAATRAVKAFPYLFYDSARDCTNSNSDCTISIDRTISYSSSFSFSVTDGMGSTVSTTMGNSTSIGVSKGTTREVSSTIETSNSFTETNSNGGSTSSSISNSLTKTHELQLGRSKTRGFSREASDTKTSEVNAQSNFNNEVNQSQTEDERFEKTDSWGQDFGSSASAGGSFLGFGASVEVHASQNENHGTTQSSGSSTTNGSSKSRGGFIGASKGTTRGITNGRSESDTIDTRASDSISDSKTNTQTSERNWSNSRANTVGNSKSHTEGSSQSYTTTENFEKQFSETVALAKNRDVQNSQSNSTEQSLSIRHELTVPKGTYGIAALLLFTKSTQVQFLCLENDKEVLVNAEVVKFDKLTAQNSVMAVINRIDAETYFNIVSPALLSKQDLNLNPSGANSIPSKYDVIILPGQKEAFNKVLLTTKNFEMIVTQFGNMKVQRKGNSKDVLWETKTSVKRSTDVIIKEPTGTKTYAGSNIRLRITDFGHILLEAEDMFKNQPWTPFNATFFDDQLGDVFESYTTIWSNVPKHMRYQIGTAKTGYNLILEEQDKDSIGTPNVDLVLYDGGGSVVWCALHCKSPNALGFRFPDNFLIPTDFRTDVFFPTYADGTPHNTLDPKIEYKSTNTFLSENQACGPILVSGQGIVSPNGRFRLILQASGNLILKDGTRTMWESMTSDVWFAKAPYAMRLSNRGIVYVTDSWNKLIFSTSLVDMQLKNTKFSLEDSGEFTVRYSRNDTIVTSYFASPRLNLFTEPIHTCYSKCTTCAPMRPMPITRLFSNGSDYTPFAVMFNQTEKLCSESNKYCVVLSNKTLSIQSESSSGPSSVNYKIKDFNVTDLNLAFDPDGRLQVFSNDTKVLLWNNTHLISGVGHFTSSISDAGRWSVFDGLGKEIWAVNADNSLDSQCDAFGWNFYDNEDIVGGDITFQPASDRNYCKTMCQNVEGCNAYTWSSKEGMCYFKGGIKGSSARVAKPDVYSAILCGNNQCKNDLTVYYDNRDFTGGDVKSVSADSVRQCARTCASSVGCTAFTFKNNVCYLKSFNTEYPASTSSQDTQSGVVCNSAIVSRDTVRVDNPYAGASGYANSEYASAVESSVKIDGSIADKANIVKNQPTAIWIDKIEQLKSIGKHLRIAGQKASPSNKVVIQFILYNLPGRDCHASASKGEIPVGGIQTYKNDYIDRFVQELNRHNNPNVRIVLIVEPDALPNLATNMKSEKCAAAGAGYKEGIVYAVSKLTNIPNVYLYLDLGHGGWLGWDDNQDSVLRVLQDVLGWAKSLNQNLRIQGFATNVAGYSPVFNKGIPPAKEKAPMIMTKDKTGKERLTYDYNPAIDEQIYVNLLAAKFGPAGLPTRFVIDTSRNGVPGIRIRWGSWCNIKGAGIGFLPKANPLPLLDAYVWAKPPGESDGASSGDGVDGYCAAGGPEGFDAMYNAPKHGQWFHDQFVALIRNANPAL